ncbi:phosphatidylinositol 3-kinase catalytic subunit type 3-like [Ptychodera flava]|uniref:phosphatidylinositol 3-kinase catalytic subunit type 3-like n=1 Tax=Ptychodera flava TaxID=63121 RepID=UPI00396A741C
MAAQDPDRFNYVYSCDLDVNVQIKIGTLEGKREHKSFKALVEDPQLRYSGLYQDGCSDMYVTCQVFADGKPLALTTRTSYKPFSTRWNWNEWLTLPVRFCDLPRNAQVALTIWDLYGPRKAIPVGGTTISLFGKHGTFRQGMHDLRVWPDIEADGSLNTTTPGKSSGRNDDQMSRLAKLTKKHRKGHMVKVDWLDRLTFREIEMINEKEKRNSNFMFLMVEFPRIHYDALDYSVVYFEKDSDAVVQVRPSAEIVKVPDPEMLLENLVESKHHKLARSVRSGVSDRDLKPNAATRDQLNVIVGYSPTKTLTSEEEDLVWKFRFYLTHQKQALTKFLKCVNWNLPPEAKQALDLLGKWQAIDVADALELLSPQFTNPTVRRYAVARLQKADDEELQLYLLQLVQALKYENFDEIKAGLESPPKRESYTQLSEMSPVERERLPSTPTGSLASPTPRTPSQCSDIESPGSEQTSVKMEESEDVVEDEQYDLATFLINRACHNFTLASYFYWFLLVECDDQDSMSKDNKISEMYITVMKRFSQALVRGGRQCRIRRSLLARQQTFVDRLVLLTKTVARESGNRKKKIERLQALLSDPEISKINFVQFDPLPLPVDPEVKVNGIVIQKAALFKSALMPCKLTFRTTNGGEYVTIFKNGDDLRQDQLILQIVHLMDTLLRQENLDLKLTTYKAIATSSRHGFIQFVESVAVADVLSNDGSIQNYFRKYAPSEGAPFGIHPDVMDTYIRSCAGYCVITYLLGIGDRHLDNLLMTQSGHLFHVDFGYILGRDPKPLPPPMKLSKEMIEGMGGANSEQYQDFRKYCYTSFLHLRRHANLILNLFSLMVDASVPDIALEPDKTVKKVQDKFRLDLSDEEAVHYMQTLIDVSASAVFAAVVEQFHKFAQYWRR